MIQGPQELMKMFWTTFLGFGSDISAPGNSSPQQSIWIRTQDLNGMIYILLQGILKKKSV